MSDHGTSSNRSPSTWRDTGVRLLFFVAVLTALALLTWWGARAAGVALDGTTVGLVLQIVVIVIARVVGHHAYGWWRVRQDGYGDLR